MGASCSCRCDEELPGVKILQSTAAVCPTGPEESFAEIVLEKTIQTRQLEVDFLLPDGSRQTIFFTRRPLGLDFNRQVPITLKHVRPGSQASDLGVKEGWKIRSLNGQDAMHLPFHEVYASLREASQHL